MRLLCLLAMLLLCTAPARAQDRAILREACMGNAVESCYISLSGPIDTGLTDRFRARYGDGIEAVAIYLDSPGGDLGEALKLGRHLRDTGLETRLGRAVPEGMEFEQVPEGGQCDSACAYVFMGGEKRSLSEGQQLGLHRFWVPGGQIDGESAQIIAGQLVTYMVEMGIDPRVFRAASEMGRDQMLMIGPSEAASFDLVTRSGYDALFLEPYKGGVIASSKRLEPTGPYDLARQATFLCRDGMAQVLVTADGGMLERAGLAPEVEIRLDESRATAARSTVRTSGETDYITLTLPNDLRHAMPRARTLHIGVWFSRAFGGMRQVNLTLSDMDRAMIASAFTHCID